MNDLLNLGRFFRQVTGQILRLSSQQIFQSRDDVEFGLTCCGTLWWLIDLWYRFRRNRKPGFGFDVGPQVRGVARLRFRLNYLSRRLGRGNRFQFESLSRDGDGLGRSGTRRGRKNKGSSHGLDVPPLILTLRCAPRFVVVAGPWSAGEKCTPLLRTPQTFSGDF